MKKRLVFALLAIFVFSLACQSLFPARVGTTISECKSVVDSIIDIQPADVPQHLMETGLKDGNEFNANDYFSVLSHVSMQEGYVLDYVYPVESLGSSPVLYARPEDQSPYTSMEDIPENTELPDFRDHVVIDNTEQGYFEYVALDIMASQFYLVWHANYNDTQIVCNSGEVNDIISSINSGSFGNEFDLAQQTKARTMRDIEPLVNLTDDAAHVQMVIFTKWGGFYRLTYTISRAFPHTITDLREENLVPYDCGVMF